jgi:exopolysaccharide biosynthesis protein
MFAHTLGVATAMAMDGGGSTQMAIYSEREGKYRIVNGPTSEHQSDTGTAGARVLNFILAWSN